MFETVFVGEAFPEWEPIPEAVLAEVGFAEDLTDELVEAGLERFLASFDEPVHAPALAKAEPEIVEVMTRPLSAWTLQALELASFPDLSDTGQSLARLTDLVSHVEALRSEVIAVIAGPAPGLTSTDRKAQIRDAAVACEVAVASRCSVYAADRQISLARDLAGRLRASRDAMSTGTLTFLQARALSEATSHLDLTTTRQVETAMLEKSQQQSSAQFQAALRRQVAKSDPEFAPKARTARREPVVDHQPGTDGTGELYLRGPLEKAPRGCAANGLRGL